MIKQQPINISAVIKRSPLAQLNIRASQQAASGRELPFRHEIQPTSHDRQLAANFRTFRIKRKGGLNLFAVNITWLRGR
jgi:hypothetical protein